MGLMLTGRSVRADRALKIGLVDRLVATARRSGTTAARHIITAAPARRIGRRCASAR